MRHVFRQSSPRERYARISDSAHMRYFDLAIILLYLVAITIFGARFRTGQKNLKDYFLGGRTAPWWAISLSIVSAETMERLIAHQGAVRPPRK